MSVDELMKQYSGAYDSDFEAELADMSCGDDSTPDDTEDEEEDDDDESSEGRSCSASCFRLVGMMPVTAVWLMLLFSSIARVVGLFRPLFFFLCLSQVSLQASLPP